MPNTATETAPANPNGKRFEASRPPTSRNGSTLASRSPSFTKAMVAELPAAEIGDMSEAELAEAIQAADVPLFRNGVVRRLEYCDRATLEQLLFLARRTCRNQGY